MTIQELLVESDAWLQKFHPECVGGPLDMRTWPDDLLLITLRKVNQKPTEV